MPGQYSGAAKSGKMRQNVAGVAGWFVAATGTVYSCSALYKQRVNRVPENILID